MKHHLRLNKHKVYKQKKRYKVMEAPKDRRDKSSTNRPTSGLRVQYRFKTILVESVTMGFQHYMLALGTIVMRGGSGVSHSLSHFCHVGVINVIET
ncbi:hypothetical protein Lal_00031503 [Lupinus albus]|nr:hypothetical protein Lal_00031503 [Lupinus albus]